MITKHLVFQNSISIHLLELILLIRALVYKGTKYICPCCGWKLRAFTRGGGSFRRRPNGYCPRCNSKARHRRIWLYLQGQTNLFSDRVKLLHISPKFCLSRQLKKRQNLYYVGADIRDQINIRLKFDLTAAPVKADIFDSVLCVHVLEHIKDDNKAIQEIYRLLKPGGWAVISVPMRLDKKTFEDPSIVTAEDRKKAFGEADHYRFYGYDLREKLETNGFSVHFDLAARVRREISEKYGLLDDENIFFMEKQGSLETEKVTWQQ